MATKTRSKAETSAKYEKRRMEVLLAAARTFNRLGFHQATLDDVAQELGVTKPALYYYAKSKDELLFACGRLALDSFAHALDKTSDPDASGLERLTRFFRLYAEIICEDFGRCLVTTEPRDLAPASRRSNIAGRRQLNHAVREIIREGIADGSIRRCDERALAIALFDAFNGIGRWYDAKGANSLAQILDQYIAIFVKGIAAKR
ncbi:MAG: TetR family transcriptional regulator [Alphaproteobacteria bacterium]|nr:TetR family transcriptional regulator [Alphaproteobacteria bacterium]